MNTQPNPKIIGSFIVGIALVAGAYVFSNFGKPSGAFEVAQNATQIDTSAAAIRTAIDVSDENGNGIEDWRDEFVSADSMTLSEDIAIGQYEAPETLTGRTGIEFIERVLLDRQQGLNDQSDLITGTIQTLQQETSVNIYDTPDIKLLKEANDETIYTYANNVATAILENNQTDSEHEMLILQDILNRNAVERLDEIHDLAELYRLTRDAVVDVPVPAPFLKQHLDLINSLHAVHHDILGLTLAYDDPTYALLRLKRYRDDVLGMVKSMENMYKTLEPHAGLFTAADSAVLFVEFSPANRIRI